MWTVYESDEVSKVVRRLPKEVLKRYEKWKDIVRISGVGGLRAIKGFHDEKLKGSARDFRSSHLGDKYRVIYSIKEEQFVVRVIRISAHDYRGIP